MQYYYVEYARAKRAVFIALILLGLFFLACLIVRFSVHDTHWETDLEGSPTAHVTKTLQPDGSTRIVIEDTARQTHAVIIKHPGGMVDMDITEPRKGSSHHGQFIMGASSVNTTVEGNTLHTTIRYKPELPVFKMGFLFLMTIPLALIIASFLGVPLAKENDGHLELAWTKPVSRERYAIASFVVDSAAIVLSQLLTIAVTLLATLMFFVPRFGAENNMGWYILAAIVAPLAWYALLTAASASLRRGPGLVIGLGWIAALLIPALAQALSGAAKVNPIAAWFYEIFHGLSYLDPIAYIAVQHGHSGLLAISTAGCAGVLCALLVGYLALAVAQWRRVEA
jgi:hypothetical protein